MDTYRKRLHCSALLYWHNLFELIDFIFCQVFFSVYLSAKTYGHFEWRYFTYHLVTLNQVFCVVFFFPPCNTNNLSGIPMYVSQKVLLLSLFSSKITQFCTYRTCLICKKSLVFERFFLSDLIQGCTVPMLMLTLMHYTVNTNTSCWFEDGKRLFMQTALASYNAQTKQWKINELNLKAWTTPTTQTLKCKTMEKEKTNKTNNNLKKQKEHITNLP